MGVAETEEDLKAKVSEVCRNYCLQVWNEAFNQAGVEAFSALRRVESVYYPPAIRVLGSANSNADTTSKVVELGKEGPAKFPTSSNNPSDEAQPIRVAKKETDATKGVAPDAIKPSVAPQDLSQEKEASPKMEIVLATLSMLAKGDFEGKGPEASEAALTQSTKTPAKEKIVIKK